MSDERLLPSFIKVGVCGSNRSLSPFTVHCHLPHSLKEAYGRRCGDIERFGSPRHGYGDHRVRRCEEPIREAAAFVAENERGVAAEVFLEYRALRALAGGDDPSPVGVGSRGEIHAFVYAQQKVRAHGGP